MDRKLAHVIERLEALRAESKELGQEHKNLLDHFEEAISQLRQAASELVESRARAEHERKRPR
jgi:hypothetical protein